MGFRHGRTALFVLALVAGMVRPAWADVTAFIGFSPKPETQTLRGFAFGINLLVIGFEVEYANAAERPTAGTPGRVTGMINGLVQTPTAATQFYLSAGGGFFRERLGTESDTSLATNIGGGVKLGLAGPLRLRVDYRVFSRRGQPGRATPQRLYAGLNLNF
jgi:hypothetical protein